MSYMIYYLLMLSKVCIVYGDNSIKQLSESNIRFTANLYQEISSVSSSNIIFSPISIQTCLALTLEGARGTTASEIATVLSLPPKTNLQAAIKNLKLDISSDELTLKSANKFYVAPGYEILTSFLNLARNIYHNNLAIIDFSSGKHAANEINQWVSDHTEGTIDNLVDPSQFNALTKFVIINCLYFKGYWSVPFQPKFTQLDLFYVEDDSIEVEMMNSVGYYPFLDSTELEAKFLDLKYEESNISMMFVLPNEVDGLTNIENNIEQYMNPKNLKTTRVAVSIPAFNISSLVDFKEILQNLGVKELFEGSANLTGMSNTLGLFVKYVFQKTFIAVTEDGTEAASATAVIASGRSLPSVPRLPELVFKADHPFLFYIKDHSSGVILFIGRYVQKEE